MAAYQLGSYLENFLESVSTLPAELRRNFTLMKELDTRSQELLDKIGQESKLLQERAKKEGAPLAEDTVEDLREDFKTALEYSDEKVALAIQTYEMVDKHIRRLDTDLRKFEAELESVTTQAPDAEPEPDKRSHKRKSSVLEEPNSHGKAPKGKGRGKAPKSKKAPESAGAASGAGDGVHPADARVLSVDIDMPIDPNEPTYCICKRVSFGEMVGCDNPECKVEWFHFECVGLTNPPKGKWLCPECRKNVATRSR